MEVQDKNEAEARHVVQWCFYKLHMQPAEHGLDDADASHEADRLCISRASLMHLPCISRAVTAAGGWSAVHCIACLKLVAQSGRLERDHTGS